MVVTGHFRRTFVVRKDPGEPLEMVVPGLICRFDLR
jgi:hypothetical protein